MFGFKKEQETRSLAERLFKILVPNHQSTRVANPTYKDAISLSAVWKALHVIGETTASVPITLKRDEEEVEEHPILTILNDRPNGIQTSFSLRESIAIHIALLGNSYLEIVLNMDGSLGSLYLLDPSRMKVTVVNNQKIFTYTQTNGGQQVFTKEQILHIPGMSLDGVSGLSAVDTLQRNLSISINTELWVSEFLENGDPFLGWFETTQDDANLTDEDKDDVMEKLAQAKSDKRFTLVLDGMTYKSRSFSPEEMQLVLQREFIVTEVARIFNIPATKIGDLTRGTFSNVEQENVSFVRDTIEPLTKRIDSAMNMLLMETEPLEGYKLQHDVEPLLAGEFKDKAETFTMLYEAGGITLNEYRKGIGYGEIENGDLLEGQFRQEEDEPDEQEDDIEEQENETGTSS